MTITTERSNGSNEDFLPPRPPMDGSEHLFEGPTKFEAAVLGARQSLTEANIGELGDAAEREHRERALASLEELIVQAELLNDATAANVMALGHGLYLRASSSGAVMGRTSADGERGEMVAETSARAMHLLNELKAKLYGSNEVEPTIISGGWRGQPLANASGGHVASETFNDGLLLLRIGPSDTPTSIPLWRDGEHHLWAGLPAGDKPVPMGVETGIGRADGGIPDERVSRIHAKLTDEAGNVQIEDVGRAHSLDYTIIRYPKPTEVAYAKMAADAERARSVIDQSRSSDIGADRTP